VFIAHAMDNRGGDGVSLWDDEDGFFYDALRADDATHPLKARSMVGLIPLFAAESLDDDLIDRLPGFKRRMQWFVDNRPSLHGHMQADEAGRRRLLSIVSRDQLVRVLNTMLDPDEFLSGHGVRALSRVHQKHPYTLRLDGAVYRAGYEPGESTTGLFGGNSNWRGPVWFPVNYLLVEALQKFDYFYGDGLKVECPRGAGRLMTLGEVARELSQRLTRIFLRDAAGRRPAHGDDARFAADPHWRDLVLFHEYFHGDTGRGLGASHQTGWTALVVKLVQDLARSEHHARP
jgi:hypothetical protein